MPHLPLSARAALLALVTAATPAPGLAQDIDVRDIPAQEFTLDPVHSSLFFSVSHLGLANYTAGFDKFTATLNLDPAAPDAAELRAEIDLASLDLSAPPVEFLNQMMEPPWLNAVEHPTASFVSSSVTLDGDTRALIEGTLSLNGIEQPVTLEAVFNAAYPAGMFEPHARIGFSATTTLNRSDFGMDFGLPAEGSKVGVGDAVSLRIEAEFTGSETAPASD